MLFFTILLFSFRILYGENDSSDSFLKVENAQNIYVGLKHIQRIKEFYIDVSLITCTDRNLPIFFNMHGEDKKHVEVRGWLTEHGALIDKQQNYSYCQIFRKYIIVSVFISHF